MSFTSVSYDEGTKKLKYHYVEVSGSFDKRKRRKFKSGNFVKDWFDSRKYIIEKLFDDSFHVHSSSLDNFIMDTKKYDSAYLHMIKDKPILKYFDRTKKDWFITQRDIEEGIEFFVNDGEQPTWEELKKYVKIKNE